MDNVHHTENPTVIVALDALYRQDDAIQSILSMGKISLNSLPTLPVGFDSERPSTLSSPPDFPDGGLRAWSVLIGVSTKIIAHFCSNGLFHGYRLF